MSIKCPDANKDMIDTARRIGRSNGQSSAQSCSFFVWRNASRTIKGETVQAILYNAVKDSARRGWFALGRCRMSRWLAADDGRWRPRRAWERALDDG
jgi:hypothetical protein